MRQSPERKRFLDSLFQVAAEDKARRVSRQDLIRTGAIVSLRGREFQVGNFLNDFPAWELIEDGEVVLAIRPNLLADMMDEITSVEVAA